MVFIWQHLSKQKLSKSLLKSASIMADLYSLLLIMKMTEMMPIANYSREDLH